MNSAAGIAADVVQPHGTSPGEVAVITRTKNLLLKVQEELAAVGMLTLPPSFIQR